MKGPAGPNRPRRPTSDTALYAVLGGIGLAYLLLILSLVVADVAYLGQSAQPLGVFARAFSDPGIRYAVHLSLVSCAITTVLSLVVAVPVGYGLSRFRFPGKALVDAVVDIPIILPPLVVGLSLLILFRFLPEWLGSAVVYQAPAVILAQFVVASSLATRTMRGAFDQIDPRQEDVALTLGASRVQAFGWVTLPAARPGLLTAATLAWARSLGEFGPLLVFAGATRQKTEVLSTTVFLELSVGNLEGAVAVAVVMITVALAVLAVVRFLGAKP